jgi:hypothetical protein
MLEIHCRQLSMQRWYVDRPDIRNIKLWYISHKDATYIIERINETNYQVLSAATTSSYEIIG